MKSLVFYIMLCAGISLNFCNNDIKNFQNAGRLPLIEPDYTATVFPPNIAPANFVIKEAGEKYFVKISTSSAEISICSNDGKIRISAKKWKNMLSQAAGGSLDYAVYVFDKNNQWLKYDTFTNQVSKEKIDSHLAYRLINPSYTFWKTMGIYQRNLENFDQKPILLNSITGGNCMNCHSFRQNDPDYMLLHLRTEPSGGTLLQTGDNLVKINTATEFNRAAAYPAWHPSGKLLAFSVNNLTMFYHSVGECRDVLDRESDLILYKIDENMVTTCDKIADPGRLETFPTWSGDGNYLYFCSAKNLEEYVSGTGAKEELDWDAIFYDLMRIPYDAADGTWGELETVISAEAIGKSIIIPRISPDNRFLLFCMANYGSFPIYHSHSDLYLMDLQSGKYWKPENLNSDQTESYHSWSNNSRWFVFSSKRLDGLLARPFFAHVDENGNVSKPFIMPQKDPEFYKTFLKTYNVPELIKGPVKVPAQKLRKVAYDNEHIKRAQLDPAVDFRKAATEEKDIYQAAPQ